MYNLFIEKHCTTRAPGPLRPEELLFRKLTEDDLRKVQELVQDVSPYAAEVGLAECLQ